jgi:hypothetical protein
MRAIRMRDDPTQRECSLASTPSAPLLTFCPSLEVVVAEPVTTYHIIM